MHDASAKLAAVLFALAIAAGAARAAVPTQFVVQGSLRDNAGRLQSMPVNASVSLFDAMSGGNRLAGPYTFATVPVQNGLFTLVVDDPAILGKLGRGAAYVEVTIGGDVYTRFAVASQLFALRAGQADTADALRGIPLAPAAPAEGQVLRFAGGVWTPASLAGGPGAAPPPPAVDLPPGAVVAFDLDRCPPGWVPHLAAAGRTIIGTNPGGNGLAARALGATVGSETHALTADEVAPHTHKGTTAVGNRMKYRSVGLPGTNARASHVTGFAGTGNFVDIDDAQYPGAIHTHDFTTDAGAVGGKPHNNMQPSLALLYCKKM